MVSRPRKSPMHRRQPSVVGFTTNRNETWINNNGFLIWYIALIVSMHVSGWRGSSSICQPIYLPRKLRPLLVWVTEWVQGVGKERSLRD